MSKDTVKRCTWCGDDPLYVTYHDEEWGVPVHDDRALFELLTLEGAQAGLSWITILRKRENYRRLFANFDPIKVAKFNPAKTEKLLQDAGIVRNRLKVESTVTNAQAFIRVQQEFGSFDCYLWGFVGDKPIQNRWQHMSDVPAKTPLAETISKALKKRGFRFVGPTIVYAYLQAAGLVNDHTSDCFRYKPVKALAEQI
jgi:DNA-3-methyladenine glycosylase I